MALIARSDSCKHAAGVAAGLLALAITTGAQAEIFKCTGSDGKAIFSDKPCGVDAQKVVVDTAPTGANLGADKLSPEEYEKKRLQLQAQSAERSRRIAEADAEVEKIKSRNYDPDKCVGARAGMAAMRSRYPARYSYDINYFQYQQAAELYCGN